MKYFLDILRGVVIGVANIIPGVSGGTMMVSMGIYDTLIHCITHLFKEFKKSILTLLPYIIGMVVGIIGLSFAVTWGLDYYPFQTNALFIGLIIGGVPAIWQNIRDEKFSLGGGMGLFLLLFAVGVGLKLMQGETVAVITLNFGTIILLVLIGALASATMVIPGVSGSMILMLLGYYRPVTSALKGLVTHLTSGETGAFLTDIGMLLPFAVGIVLGIFGIAKLIEGLMRSHKGLTYCAIAGLVLASPEVIIMTAFEGGQVLTWTSGLMSLVMMAVGAAIAWSMGRLDADRAGKDLRRP